MKWCRNKFKFGNSRSWAFKYDLSLLHWRWCRFSTSLRTWNHIQPQNIIDLFYFREPETTAQFLVSSLIDIINTLIIKAYQVEEMRRDSWQRHHKVPIAIELCHPRPDKRHTIAVPSEMSLVGWKVSLSKWCLSKILTWNCTISCKLENTTKFLFVDIVLPVE